MQVRAQRQWLLRMLFRCGTAVLVSGWAPAATFHVSFQNIGPGSGFDDDALGLERQNAVADAVAHLEALLLNTGSCDVLFQEVTSDQISGLVDVTTAFTSPMPGYRNGDAFEHLVHGVDLDPLIPDIIVQVHFDEVWYLGEPYCDVCGPDLRTHVLAAMLQGLGLQSALDASGGSTIAPGVFTHWDRLLTTGRGVSVLHDQDDAPQLNVPDSALEDSVVGIRFNGPFATEALGEAPFVSVTASFTPGISLQHFRPGTTLGAVKELLDEIPIPRRRLTPIDIAALRDIGYEVTQLPADLVVTTLNDLSDMGDTSSVDALNLNPGFDGISLREAIAAANATPGYQIIRFAVTGTMHPLTPLPVVLDESGGMFLEAEGEVTLSGAAQDGGGVGLEFQYANSLIRGLRLVDFPEYAIALRSYGFGYGNRVVGCWIGLDAEDNPGSHNGGGILIQDSARNVVGGSVESARNIIAHNTGPGILVRGEHGGNTIMNNAIHTNAGGGIVLEDSANADTAPPSITSLAPLEGTGPLHGMIEFYADDEGQGRLPISRVFLDGTHFSLFEDLHAYEGMNLTATATTAAEGSTSEFTPPNPIDLEGPVLTLLGANPFVIEAGSEYVEPGATAMDIVDGDLTDTIVIEGSVSPLVPGDYMIHYDVADSAGHTTHVVRTVTVVDTTPPALELNGPFLVMHRQGLPYLDPGVVAIDVVDGDRSHTVEIDGVVDIHAVGDYELTYTARDSAGNQASIVRIVRVAKGSNTVVGVTPSAGPSGTLFHFTALPEDPNESYSYTWDFAGFGSSAEQNPVFAFPNAAPGSYEITVAVASDGVFPEIFTTTVTLTHAAVDGAGRVDPDAESIIRVDSGPLAGAEVIVPPGAVDEPVVIAISQVDTPPSLIAGAVNRVMRLEPAGLVFNVPVTVRIPHPVSWYHYEVLEVLYYNENASQWQDDGITNVTHVDAGSYHYVECQTTHFTVFMAKSLVPSGIQGQVFSTSGVALDGATVTIDPAGLNLTCDATGFYTTIADLAPSTYTVKADKQNTHCEDTKNVNVDAADLARQDFELAPRNPNGTCGRTGSGCHGGGRGTGVGDIIMMCTVILGMAAALHRPQARVRHARRRCAVDDDGGLTNGDRDVAIRRTGMLTRRRRGRQ